MIKLKFLVLGLFALLTLNLTAQKHADRNPEQHQQKRLEKLAQELNLSPAQLSQVKTLQDKFFAGEKVDRKAEHEAHRAEMKAKLAPILTPEQLKKAEALEAEHDAKRSERRAHKDANKDVKEGDKKGNGHKKSKEHKDHKAAQFERMSAELGLNESQKTQVLALFEAEKAEKKAEREARHAAKKEHMQAYEAEMSTILTAEQQQKFEVIKAERAEKRHDNKGKRAYKNDK